MLCVVNASEQMTVSGTKARRCVVLMAENGWSYLGYNGGKQVSRHKSRRSRRAYPVANFGSYEMGG